MVLYDLSTTERLQDIVDAIWVIIRFDVRETLLQHAPGVLDTARLYKRVFLVNVEI